ncbi:hypothetical protein [Loigolactobacillus backii]|uniref:Uncharacterized protein n=1 Tax=Loigolactobacillus backii TaxID=375175 RepID=A0A192H3M9_9LACO|nr:hypothetical protein [Loigolactobacillus backii]ANK62975.1 hypothetical protein AYR53_09505 [Loigolactobacillus backii]ANK70017.1 hypothetical protein AYR56_07500 [Loigolactobacillus backii]MDA5388807.1 hypothetical protein [Loigolactobacillus backii]MDA5391306.1 hypothetical protein [Loigolactobacillus backii]PIO83372.1 hypothetical protein BSQ39_07295 [Loigolactobacillus backii]
MDFSKFKPYVVSAGVSTLTIGKGGISFSKTAVLRLEKAAYVELLINDEDHILVIKPVTVDSENATVFFRAGKKNIMVRWNYQDLTDRLAEMMGWKIQETTYKVKGEYNLQEGILIFDLNKARPIHQK